MLGLPPAHPPRPITHASAATPRPNPIPHLPPLPTPGGHSPPPPLIGSVSWKGCTTARRPLTVSAPYRRSSIWIGPWCRPWVN
jgi:hypothetical protein